ncbi:MAG: zf-HC2 domain-containing protein [Planctomycetota bacterium]
MKHEDIHERLALRLYGELDPAESRALDEHLRDCEECRQFASELEHGLGRVVAVRTSARDELPPDWAERLQAATRDVATTAPRPSVAPERLSPWWAAAAGIAAGLLLALSALRVGGGETTNAPRGEERSAYAHYYGGTAPPLATSGGQWSRLATQRRP